MPKSKVAAKAIKDQKNPKKVLADKKSKASKTIKKTGPAEGGLKSEIKRRQKPGAATLREIKRYQRQIDVLMPRAPFQRLVRKICEDVNHEMRF